MKRCARCKKKIPADRKSSYCKPCATAQVRRSRERQRLHRETEGYQRIVAREKGELTARLLETVRDALRRGYTTRNEIKDFTGLSADSISDALAEMNFNNQELRFVRDGEEARFYLVAA